LQEFCLHPLVAARHDRAALFAALRGLTAAQAVALLRYLLFWVRLPVSKTPDCLD
jgi:hypothetical protein